MKQEKTAEKFELVIWDFDGVIADTEKLWLQTRLEMLNEKFALNWNFATAAHYLAGMSDRTKAEVLQRLGIETDKTFWDEALKRDYKFMQKGFVLTPGIREIFAYNRAHRIKQCIATGGILSKTLDKIRTVGIEDIFPAGEIFTVDMVKHGKPEPDIFLFAAAKMKTFPQNCAVIEDSPAGLEAALRAGMTAVAFAGSEMNKGEEFRRRVEALGVKHIFDTMAEVAAFLKRHY